MDKVEHLQRQEVIREALSWIPTPFVHEACVKHVGVDCSRFPFAVYTSLSLIEKVELPHVAAEWNLHRDAPTFDPNFIVKFCQRLGVEVAEPKPGDAVVLWIPHAYAHMGIVIDWPKKVIHCAASNPRVVGGVAISDASEDVWVKRYQSIHPPRFFSPWKNEQAPFFGEPEIT